MTLPNLAAGPNLIQSLKTFRSIMVNASGVLFWIPLSFYVSIEHSKEIFNTLTRILLPLIILYFLIFFIKSFKARTILNLIVFFFVYITIYLYGFEIETIVIPFGLIFISGIILTAFGLDFKYSLTVLPLLLLMEYLVATEVGDKLILSGASYNLGLFMLSHSVIAFIGISFNYSLEKTLKLVDKETLEFALQNQTQKALLIQKSLLRNLKNKIHGLLLTHLSLIGQKRMKIVDKNLIWQIQQDLSSTHEIEAKLDQTSFADLIQEVTSNETLGRLNIYVDPLPYLQLPKNLANDVSEVLIEVLRNIDKHAAAKNVNLRAKLQRDYLIISVEDDGVGPGKIKDTRFGVRSAIIETLTSINGTVKYLKRDPRGTVAEITIPTKQEITLKNLTPSYISKQIYSKEIKILLIFLQIILYVYLLTNSIALNNPLIIAIQALVIFSLTTSLISRNPQFTFIFSALFFIFSLIFIFQASIIFNEVSNAGSWNWILNAFNLTFIFFIGFQRNPILRWWTAAIYLSLISAILINIPQEISAVMLPPFITGGAFGIAFVGAILMFNKRIIDKISLFETIYMTENYKLANDDFQKTTNSLWQTNPAKGADLITRAITHPELLADPAFVREAQIEQARLRSLLNIDPSIESELNLQILRIIQVASSHGNIFELEFHGSQEANPHVPSEYFEFVESLARIKQKAPISASIFSSEIDIQVTLVVEKAAYQTVMDRENFTPLSNTDWLLDMEKDEETSERVWFLISKSRTSDGLAHSAQTSSTQKAIQ